MLREQGVHVVKEAGTEKRQADREKDFQRGIEGADLEDDQQEAQTVAPRVQVTLADALGRHDGDVGDQVAGPEETHRDRGRVGELIRQQVQEALEFFRIDRAKARGEVLYALAHHQAGQFVVKAVGGCPVHACLVGPGAGADCHVVALVELGEQGADIFRAVLAVGIHKHQYFAFGDARARLDRGAIAHAVGMAPHSHLVRLAHQGGTVTRAIVDDDDLGARDHPPQFRQQVHQRRRLVFRGKNNGHMAIHATGLSMV